MDDEEIMKKAVFKNGNIKEWLTDREFYPYKEVLTEAIRLARADQAKLTRQECIEKLKKLKNIDWSKKEYETEEEVIEEAIHALESDWE